MLAPSEPEETLQGLLSQLVRYSFCETCGDELEGLALITPGQKSLFPHLPALTISFAISYTGVVILGRNIMVLCFTGLIVARNTLRVMHRHSGDK